jgi:hypothetical protein
MEVLDWSLRTFQPYEEFFVMELVPFVSDVAVVAVAALPEQEVDEPFMFIVWPEMNVATAAAVPEYK